jgi:hypothetical protein
LSAELPLGTRDTALRIGQSARVRDWTGTSDDPSGYAKMRSFLTEVAARLTALGVGTADQVTTAATWIGSPSEWLGESAVAIEATLDVPDLPSDFVEDLNSAFDAIREGFRRVGTEPTF